MVNLYTLWVILFTLYIVFGQFKETLSLSLSLSLSLCAENELIQHGRVNNKNNTNQFFNYV